MLTEPQLPGRDQFKHIIHGPDGGTFPFVRDAIEKGDWKLAERQIKKTAQILGRAGERLLH